MCATTSTASCRMTRTLRQRQRVDLLQQRADAGRVHFDAEEVVLRMRLRDRRRGLAHAEADLEDDGRARVRRPARSRAARARTRCRSAAATRSSARVCAGDIRPWRSTKLRTGRTGGAAAESASAVTRAASERFHSVSASVRSCVRGFASPAACTGSSASRASFHVAVTSDHARGRRETRLLAHAVARDAPHGDLVVAALAQKSATATRCRSGASDRLRGQRRELRRVARCSTA